MVWVVLVDHFTARGSFLKNGGDLFSVLPHFWSFFLVYFGVAIADTLSVMSRLTVGNYVFILWRFGKDKRGGESRTFVMSNSCISLWCYAIYHWSVSISFVIWFCFQWYFYSLGINDANFFLWYGCNGFHSMGLLAELKLSSSVISQVLNQQRDLSLMPLNLVYVPLFL